MNHILACAELYFSFCGSNPKLKIPSAVITQLKVLHALQVNHILACAELYFSCRAKLQNEQRALQQQLKSTSASTEGLLLTTAQEDSPMKPWLDRLANNLKREHVLRVMLNGFVWFKVFTPVQCAKAAVYRCGSKQGHLFNFKGLVCDCGRKKDAENAIVFVQYLGSRGLC